MDTGLILSVDEDDLENANPSSFDLVENLCQLMQLNESSVLHCLRQRFASNLIHTLAGNFLIFINPVAPLSLYSEKVIKSINNNLWLGIAYNFFLFLASINVSGLQSRWNATAYLFFDTVCVSHNVGNASWSKHNLYWKIRSWKNIMFQTRFILSYTGIR